MDSIAAQTTPPATSVTRAGMIGLGAMGLPMAGHMAAKGFSVAAYDVAPGPADRAAELGIIIGGSPAEVGRHAEVVVIMVATDKQVEEVFFKSGLLEAMRPGAVVCISSSCAPATCKKLEQAAAEKGVGVLDTPVVLGQEACNNGTMTVFVGGAEPSFQTALPVLRSFGEHIVHLGPSGSGQVAKSVNNLLLWATITANYEALSFAKQLGVNLPRLIEAMGHSSGANWALARWGKSTGKWAEKDMDVALELAQDVKLPMPLAALVDQLMKGMNQEKMRALLD